jgi:hypothetical protein
MQYLLHLYSRKSALVARKTDNQAQAAIVAEIVKRRGAAGRSIQLGI